MLDFNHKKSTSEIITNLIGEGLRKHDNQAPRNYLGASAIGGPCERQIQYEYTHTPPDEPLSLTQQQYGVFAAGHWYEDRTIEELRAAGFTVVTRRRDGTGQIGFTSAGGRFKGHCDGVIAGGPDGFQYPALFEHKALGQKSFTQVKKEKVRTAKPEYAAQIAIYQAYLELTDNPAFFVARHRDTQELYVELVPFDGELAQRMSDRAARVIQASEAGETLSRHTNDQAHFVCRFCKYAQRCWR